MKKSQFYISILLAMLAGKAVFSQITAHISIEKTKYCVPELVTMGNGSTTGDTIMYRWNFGKGGGLQPPKNSAESQTIYYDKKGLYTITLIAYSSNNPMLADTAFATISVNNKPSADYLINDPKCAPATYYFTDNSTFDESNYASSVWLINGKKYIGDSILHTFEAGGNFIIDYTVTDSNGCWKNISNTLSIPAKPAVSFTADIAGKCEPPFNIKFTNTTSVEYPVEYIWKWDEEIYADETFSDQTIADYEKHLATLIAKSNTDNCIDSAMQEFHFTTYDPQIVVYKNTDPTSMVTQGATEPRGVYYFRCATNVSGEIKWEINGKVLSGQQVSEVFCQSGEVAVTLTTNADSECPKTATFNFTIDKNLNNSFVYTSKGNVVAENETACNFDTYLKNTLPATHSTWYFNGDTVTGSTIFAYPCHPGIYKATLISAYNDECRDTITRNIQVQDCRDNDVVLVHRGDTVNINDIICTDTVTLINKNTDLLVTWTDSTEVISGNDASFLLCADGYNYIYMHTEYTYECAFLDTITIKTKKCNRDNFTIINKSNNTEVIDGSTICKSYFDVFYPDSTVKFKQWVVKSNQNSITYNDSSFVFISLDNRYDISLISTVDNGCIDTVKKTIHFDPVKSDFDINATYGCPYPIDAKFVNKSSGAVSYNWYEVSKYDTTLLANSVNYEKIYNEKYVKPNKIFHSAQELYKPIILVSTSPDGCKDTIIKPLNKPLTTAKIAASPTQGCKELDVIFSSDSKVTHINNPIISYQWFFGDGSSKSFNYSNIASEAEIFSNCILNQTAISDADKQKLSAKMAICTDEKSSISCFNGVGFELEISECECINEKVHCMVKEANNAFPKMAELIEGCYQTALQSSGKVIHHTYTETGEYEATLIVGDAYGCTDTAHINILVGDTVNVSLEVNAPSDTLRTGDNVELTFSTANISQVDSWHLMPNGDNVVKGCGQSNSFNLDVQGLFSDNFSFTVIATQNGCETIVHSDSLLYSSIFIIGDFDSIYTSLPDTNIVESNMPYGRINITTDICNPQIIHIHFETNDTLNSWAFDMGDGTLVRNQTSFLHTYNNAGTYQLSFLSDPNNAQSASVITSNYVIRQNNLNAEITMDLDDTLTCSYNSVRFSSEKSTGYVTNYFEPFLWLVDGVPKERTWKSAVELNSFLTPGDHLVQLVAFNKNGCSDTAEATVHSVQPVANMSFDKEYLCNITDKLTMYADLSDKSIKSWKWQVSLSDTIQDFGYEKSKTVELVTEYYNKHQVMFVVKDTLGCIDTTYKSINQYVPEAANSLSKSSICLGESVEIYSNSFGYDNIQWILPDGTIKNTQSLIFTPERYGNHTVKQVAIKNGTCTDTAESIVRVQQVDATFDIAQDTICRGNELVLQQKNIYDEIHYTIDFENTVITGYTSELISSSTLYTTGGIKHIRLNVASSANCTDSHDTTIYVVSAVPQISDRTICQGDLVTFENNDILATRYVINFGNGTDTTVENYSSLAALYMQRGTYNATFMAEYPSCSDTFSTVIRVQQADASFTITDSVICNYYESEANGTNLITFSHTNKLDPIASGQWQYFKNGEISQYSGESTFFRYTVPGIQEASLIVRTSYGCTDTAKKTIIVNGTMGNYRTSSNEICINDSITFFPVDLKYVDSLIWIFDDGFASNNLSPTHGYFSEGFLQPALKLFDTTGCVNVVVGNKIKIWDVVANFDINNELICQFDTLNITEYSKDASRWNWDFGNGDVSAEKNPKTYAYQTPGKYTVNLIASNHIECSDTAFVNIEVFRVPTPTFTTDKNYLCGSRDTLRIEYDLNDASIESFIWSYGDNNSRYNNGLIQYTFDEASFNDTIVEHRYVYPHDTILCITLKATDTIGCVNRVIEPINVYRPTVNFTILDKRACSGAPVEIVHNSMYVDSVNWYYSNGVAESSKNDVAPVFDTRGDYYITAIGYSKERCRDTLTDSINIQEISAHFKISDHYICDEDSIIFEHEYAPDPVMGIWSFEPGITSNYTNAGDSLQVHYFNKGGSYTVNLSLHTSNGCTDSFDTLVYVNQALPVISDSAICTSDTINFNNNTEVALQYIWTFGNGDTITSDTNSILSSVYPIRGNYTVSLIAYHPGCSDTITLTNIINVEEVNVAFTLNAPFVCINDSLTVSHTYIPDPVTGFWNWGDTSFTAYTGVGQSIEKHKYANGGNYIVELAVQTANGCKDTAQLPLTLIEAKPIVSDYAICEGDSVIFKNTYDYEADYQWNFANGTIITQRENNSVNTTYPIRGNYLATLKIATQYCADSVSILSFINVENADAQFLLSDSAVCNSYPKNMSQSNNIVATHLSYPDSIISGNWFINGNSINPYKENDLANTTFQYLFTNVGTHTIGLHIQTKNGCTDKDSIEVKVFGAKGDYSVDTQIVCLGDSVLFAAANLVDVDSLVWQFETGDIANNDTVYYTYRNEGIYFPNVVLFTEQGCINELDSVEITVANVKAGFTFDRDNICLYEDLSIIDTSYNAITWFWQFNNQQTSTAQTPKGIRYALDKTYAISLHVTDQYGCIDSIERNIIVHPNPELTLSANPLICLDSTAALRAKYNENYTIEWYKDGVAYDADTSAISDAFINGESQYSAIVTDIYGCRTTDSVIVKTRPYPIINQNITDTSVVIAEMVELIIHSDIPQHYEWAPKELIELEDSNRIIVKTLGNITYSVTASDSCHSQTFYYNIEMYSSDSIPCNAQIPTGFTPNGDGENDNVKIRGWGLEELEFLRIYNRFGQLVFESKDLSEAWNGKYKGIPQNGDTYSYQYRIKTYCGFVLENQGYINLIR